MRIVVDASVIVKWLIPDPEIEPDVDRALAVLEGIRGGRLEPIQPAHWLIEVLAVLVRLTPESFSEATKLLTAMELPVLDGIEVLKRGGQLAHELDHHLFDTLYHALAFEERATLITADRRYWLKAKHLGQLVFLPRWSGSLADLADRGSSD